MLPPAVAAPSTTIRFIIVVSRQRARAIERVVSIEWWRARNGFGQKLPLLVDGIGPLDDKRFRIRLKTPFPLMFALATPDIRMIMPRRSAAVDPFKQVTDATGSGLFHIDTRSEKHVPRQ